MLDFIVRWSEKAKSLVRANIIWNSYVHLQEQIRMYQVSLNANTPPPNMYTFNEEPNLKEMNYLFAQGVIKHVICSLLSLPPCSQSVLRESRELHGDLESMAEKVELLSEVLQVESMSQQVCELSRHSEELQQNIRTRLQSLEDADKVGKNICNI